MKDWTSGRDLDGFRRKERSAHRESGDARPLAGILGDYLRRSSLGEALLPGSDDFLAAWKEAAGPFAARCEPTRWQHGVLWVKVPDPGWKFELRWKAGPIAQALRDRGFPVREIRILP